MRYGICAAALCAIAAPVAAGARAHPSMREQAKLAPSEAPAATPAPDSGGVSAPLPRGNPGDPVGHQGLERVHAATRDSAAGEARASETEAKESVASPGAGSLRDTEGK